MADRYKKLMDKRAGPGGVKCYCCGLDKKESRTVRRQMKLELKNRLWDSIDGYALRS